MHVYQNAIYNTARRLHFKRLKSTNQIHFGIDKNIKNINWFRFNYYKYNMKELFLRSTSLELCGCMQYTEKVGC